MPCAIGIAIVIVAAALAAAIFFIAPIGDCKAYPPVFDGELLAPGWGYTFREADAVLTGRVARRLGSQPVLPWDEDEEPKSVVADYQIDVGRFWYPLLTSDRTVAVTVSEVNPDHQNAAMIVIFHTADLAVGQRVLLFLSHIPVDREAQQAGDLGMGYPVPQGFSYRNHYSVMAVFRYGLECGA